jgi:hypothetical protein
MSVSGCISKCARIQFETRFDGSVQRYADRRPGAGPEGRGDRYGRVELLGAQYFLNLRVPGYRGCVGAQRL